MRNNKISDCTLIDLSKIENRSGNITVIENNLDIPFEVKRIFYLYDIPGGKSRGAHAHKELMQLVVAASGSFEIELNDGVNSMTYMLRQPDQGLLIPSGLWRDLRKFSGGGICLVLASMPYIEDDYIRTYKEFLNWKES